MERATNSSLILYTTEDGLTKIEATFDRDTVWLSIDQMADLFQRNSFCNSHSIPQFALKRIAEDGKVMLPLQDEILISAFIPFWTM